MYVTDLAGEDESLKTDFESALHSDETFLFSLPDNETGGCMIKLPNNGGYLVQVFPFEASRRMIVNANSLGYGLAAFLLLLYVAILVALVAFYRSQQKQVEEARNQAEMANQAKTSFLFNMSHDIRTPMNAILGYTNIGLQHSDEPDRVRDSFKKIKSSGGHLLRLINDILEMSRIESGKLELDDNPVDIREAVAEISTMSHTLAVAKSIDFQTVMGDIKNPYILADELHINEVIINLISNAIKYTEAGGKVRYIVDQVGDAVDGKAMFRLEITDTGIGMGEEFQKHLFESFTRENRMAVTKTEGTGLGLAIAKRIVDMAGGTVEVKSKKGEGSSFVLNIPFKVMNEQEIEAFKSIEHTDKDMHRDVVLEGRRVLLVEDNEMNREIATEILSDAKLLVETAEDGVIAVNMVAENPEGHYDFILMDIQMPVMNGYEATKAIRRLEGGDMIPIIALSANAFAEDIEKSIEAGMNAHIAKPIDIKQLFNTMYSLADL